MIWLRRANTPNLSRGLTDSFTVKSHYFDLTSLQIHRERNTIRRRKFHRMRVTDKKSKIFALQLRAVTDADELQLALELVVERVVAVHEARGAGAGAIAARRLDAGFDDVRMPRKAEVVIARDRLEGAPRLTRAGCARACRRSGST